MLKYTDKSQKYISTLMPTQQEIQTLKNLLKNLHILNEEDKLRAINLLPKLSNRQFTKLKNKVLEIYQKLETSYKSQNAALEGFIHEKVNPLFRNAEQKSKKEEKQNLNEIISKLKNT